MNLLEQNTCGTWRLEREIGRGAYGIVYLAVNAEGARAAVKVCRRADITDECYARERRGAKLFREIPPQRGLVRMRELVEVDWGFYTVMDLADDEFADSSVAMDAYRPKTLASVIAGEKALSLAESVDLALALTEGLVTLQKHHLLHRDIKPANVLYVGGKPVLSDPGLVVEEASATSLVGTPGYVPPERFTSSASDIYSLGLVLKAASFGRRVEDLAKGPAAEADTGAPQFAAWWRILNKATDETPARRYQSAKAMLKDVRRLHFKVAVSRAERVKKIVGRVLLVLVIIFLLASAVFLIGREWRRAEVSSSRQPSSADVASAQEALKEMERANEKLQKEVEALKQKQEAEERRILKMRDETVADVRTNAWFKIMATSKKISKEARRLSEESKRAPENSHK